MKIQLDNNNGNKAADKTKPSQFFQPDTKKQYQNDATIHGKGINLC